MFSIQILNSTFYSMGAVGVARHLPHPKPIYRNVIITVKVKCA